jgi:hypothetical protein
MYYPKSKIQTNLYTNGYELAYLSTLNNYVGFYYKTYDGKYFSGKSNDDVTSEELLDIKPAIDSSEEYQTSPEFDNINATLLTIGYNQMNLPILSKLPIFIYSTPTQDNYKNGRFERYFVRKSNEPKFIEIDKLQFERFLSKDPQYAWQFYIPFFMTWSIGGDKDKVKETNFRIASQIQSNNKVYGFIKYLELTGGFDKFYKYTEASNLYTAGGEFKTANGQNYIGDYHIHDSKGPMIGKTHIKEPHGYLFPINEAISPRAINQQKNIKQIQSTSSYKPTPMNMGGGYGGGGGGGGGGY